VVHPSSGPQAWHPWPPGPAGPAGRPAPPSTVSLASVLLVVAAVLVLLPLVSLVYDLTHFGDVLRRAAERTAASPQEVSQERAANRIVTGVAIAVVLLTAAALFLPALWLRRGNRVARVLSCIAGVGAALCCCAASGLGVTGQSGSQLQSEVSRLSVRETPAWVGLTALPAVLVAPLAITAVVLLLLPASNRFFRPGPVPAQQPAGGYYVYPAQWGGRPGDPPSGSSPANPQGPPANPPHHRDHPSDDRDHSPVERRHPPDDRDHPPDSPPRG
jgi:hypothetical protein